MHIAARRLIVCVGIVVGLLTASVVRSATPKEIDRAIEAAQKYLYAQQKDGNWEKVQERTEVKTNAGQSTSDGQWGGLTAVATYALLASGENYQSPKLTPAVDFLKKAEIEGVYALAMRCQVWLFLPRTPEVREAMKNDYTALMAAVRTKDEENGYYGYTPEASSYSRSRGQYAVLGVWAATQLGFEVPANYWTRIEKAWIRDQQKSGGWNYKDEPDDDYPITPGMTAAGVATLFITLDQLHPNEGAECKGNISSSPIDKGLKYLSDHFDEIDNDKQARSSFRYATMYQIERAGVASGLRRFKGEDWYQTGADWLIKTQRDDGSWSSGRVTGSVPDTAFSLLFLSRGRAPVIINKLNYAIDAGPKGAKNWNQRPRDAANLARWIAKETERDLNWQIVDSNSPVRDWHDAPILYISGNETFNLPDETIDKLRQYCEEGGLILGNADCGALAFAGSFRKLGQKMFPLYEFRELPADHIIYTGQQFPRSKWKTKPPVLGLSNGVREMMLLIPSADASKAWQTQDIRTGMLQMGANTFLYSINKKYLRKRGDTHVIDADDSIKATKTIKLARLEYAGNWNPEPGGWRRLANLLHNERKIDLDVKTAKFDGSPIDAQVAHMTGTAAFTLNESQRESLKKFVEGGGTLIVDSAGGSGPFAASAESELTSLFGETGKQLGIPLDANYPIFWNGKAVEISYRDFARVALVGKLQSPRVRGIEIDGRLAVILSREDLSAGLVGSSTDGIMGYTPETSTNLMTSILMHSTGLAPTSQPSARPATKPAQ